MIHRLLKLYLREILDCSFTLFNKRMEIKPNQVHNKQKRLKIGCFSVYRLFYKQ